MQDCEKFCANRIKGRMVHWPVSPSAVENTPETNTCNPESQVLTGRSVGGEEGWGREALRVGLLLWISEQGITKCSLGGNVGE